METDLKDLGRGVCDEGWRLRKSRKDVRENQAEAWTKTRARRRSPDKKRILENGTDDE
jgi:hypothetical protein